jgi:hypothetical protein
VNDDNILRLELEIVHQAVYGLPAQVHIGLRFSQYDVDTLYFAASDSGIGLLPVEFDAVFFREMFQAHKTDVMAVIGISLSRVAQTDN